MRDAYDVIVVGSGPAGSSAAYFLGEAGWKVLLLEKASLPRYKPCGGGIAARLLETFPFTFEPVIESRVAAVSYALGDQDITVPLEGQPVFMVMRDRFDQHILAHARADVREQVPVRIVTEGPEGVRVETKAGECFRAHYLIAADGANSIVARQVGLRRHRRLAAAIEAEVEVPSGGQRRFANHPLFIFGEVERGYLWVFPKAAHLSVGIGAYGASGATLKATLARVMGRYGIWLEGSTLHGHPLPIYTGREPLATARTLLIGDAAGLVDPLTGEGIRFAVKSGRLAAEALLAGEPHRYAARVRREIGISHQFGLGLSLLFYRFPRACFRLGVANPFATDAFVELLGDRATYPEVIARLAGTLPLFLLMEGAAHTARRLGKPEEAHRIRTWAYSNHRRSGGQG